ncbi:hypothetical protein H0E87_027372 [Populus deltoides]|uniref:Uncharacterized protein n=1 Tax=Populus deltoides TaxID=3696 RepID=A0A8T2X180_POPDE|nr:hypothetical protein H0E87_027372 [Populus deltoides]
MCFFLPGNYLKFYDAKRSAYPDIKIISNCDGSSRSLDHPADYYDFHVLASASNLFSMTPKFDCTSRTYPKASVSDHAVTGNDVGTGSLLAALADAGFLIWSKKEQGTDTERNFSMKVESRCNFLDVMQVVPAQSMIENADKDMDVVLSPYSLTSFDLLTESNNIRTPQIDSF